jgi:hypothetical protein
MGGSGEDGGGIAGRRDEAAPRAFACAGGLTPLEVIDVDTPCFYRSAATALRGFGAADASVKAIWHVGEEALPSAIRAALSSFCQVDGTSSIGARCRCLVASPA